MLGLLALVVAVVIPASARELAFAKRAIAHAQVDEITRVVRGVLHDTRLRPQLGGYGSWIGPGEPPRPLAASDGVALAGVREKSPPASLAGAIRGAWRGPYRLHLTPDPYGRAYVVTSFGDAAAITWCLSAGPNGLLETTAADLEPAGDDVGARVD